MKCHMCQQEVSASSAFCDYCGVEMKRDDFDSIAQDLVRETEEEKKDKIETEMRNYMALSIIAFMVVMTLSYIVPETPKADVTPNYFHKEIKSKKKKIQVPYMEAKIPG